jgi:hypothetical protein
MRLGSRISLSESSQITRGAAKFLDVLHNADALISHEQLAQELLEAPPREDHTLASAGGGAKLAACCACSIDCS